MTTKLMMVLNDGETYTDLEGCKIVEIFEGRSDPPWGWGWGATPREDESTLVKYAAEGGKHHGRVITVFHDPN